MELTTISAGIIPIAKTDELIKAFINSLDVAPVSRQTYSRAIQQFFKWVDSRNYHLSQLTRVEILEYKDHLLNGRTSLSAAAYITALKNFYTWAESTKLYPNITRDIKLPKRKQEFKRQPLYPQQVAELLEHFDTKGKRDQAIIYLMLVCGLRTIEVIRANVGDIDYKQVEDPETKNIILARVLKIQGKGRDTKDEFVIIPDLLNDCLQKYLSTRKKTAGISPLFVSESNRSINQRLTTRTIRSIAKEGLKAIGINHVNYTAHSFRHSAGTNILLNGGTLEQAQRTLRHTNPATTQIYTHTLNDIRRVQNSGESFLATLYQSHKKTA